MARVEKRRRRGEATLRAHREQPEASLGAEARRADFDSRRRPLQLAPALPVAPPTWGQLRFRAHSARTIDYFASASAALEMLTAIRSAPYRLEKPEAPSKTRYLL